MNAGADIDSQDNRKVSCLMTAFRKGHVKVVKWMVKHVTQLPSDPECIRCINTINDKVELNKHNQDVSIYLPYSVFPLLDLYAVHIPIPIAIICRKAPLGPIPMVIPMQSYCENCLKNHLIGTNIGVKLGAVPICIGIEIGLGSVETVLHIIILAI